MSKQGQHILDVCCGTGTIAITLEKIVANRLEDVKIWGIELVAEAIKDAEQNAALNNCNRVRFINDSAEKVLPSFLSDALTDAASTVARSYIAVLDPPRAGLPKRVLSTIRRSSQIDQLVMVNCDAHGLYDMARRLTRVDSRQTAPFLPIHAEVVDMFPQTKQMEIVTVWQRQQQK
jgi:23S rRNA (uracil1939-C5)-methyltransferase